MTAARALVVGIGNELRGDDGVGPAVVAALGGRRLRGVALAVSDGEPGRLLGLWERAALVVVVDAVRTDHPVPGRIHRLVVDQVAPDGGATTHGFGLGAVFRLARALDRLPPRVVVIAVEGVRFDLGAKLCPQVAAVVEPVADLVCRQLRARPPTRV